MHEIISRMLEGYERGKSSRRQLIQGLAALATAVEAASASGSTFQGVSLNHIALRVTEIPRSRDFYQKHFGMPLLSEAPGNCFLGLGKDFLTLFRNQNPGLDHYCIAIENFQPDRAMEELKRQGIKPTRQSNRIYFPDPDGLTVQISAVNHQPG